MAYYSDSLSMTENTFLMLRNLIMEKTGIYFEEGKKELLADKLSDRVLERGLNSFMDYYYLLKYDKDAPEEWHTVLDLISVNETYFWREFDHIETMIRRIIPEFVKNNPARPLKIWSAACATGEEPLSILMALDSSGWLGKVRTELLATDGSRQVIEKAKEGLYRERSVRLLNDDMRSRYFDKEDSRWRVKPKLHGMIKWGIINLSDPVQRNSVPEQNIIFCRNVFIYFHDDVIRRIVNDFHSRLSSPGYLFTGFSESLFRIKNSFELVEMDKTFIYKKT